MAVKSNSFTMKIAILLSCCFLSLAAHQLKYISTLVEPEQTFTVVVELDDQQILHCDSSTMQMVPDAEWMKKVPVLEKIHWNKESESAKKEKDDLELFLDKIMKHFTQQGDHSLSQIHGCYLNNENEKGSGFKRYEYDQEEFLRLDLNSVTWTPVNDEAKKFLKEQNWDSTKTEANTWKEMLEVDCINNLQLYVKYSMYPVTHSMQNFYTAVRGIDFPEFTAVGMVDGQQFTYYDSNIMKKIPKTEWIKKVVGDDPGYWDTETQILQGNQEWFKVGVDTLMQRFNQTGGVHTVQRMYGCELDDDGTIRGYDQYGYDGEDFISLDLKTLTWTAANNKAVITKHKLESTGADAHIMKNYLENICIDWLKKYVSYGRETLQRRVPPKAELFQEHATSPELVCHATGFFPRAVMMSWQKDGEEVEEDVEVRETLPNQDGSFQKRIILRVSPEDLQKNKYTCVVQHSGLEEELRVELRDDGVPTGMIIGGVVVLLVLVLVAGGIVMWKKNNSGFKPVSSGPGSNSDVSVSSRSSTSSDTGSDVPLTKDKP